MNNTDPRSDEHRHPDGNEDNQHAPPAARIAAAGRRARMDIPNKPVFQPADLPPKGSIWRKTSWGDRTVVGHYFNSWSGCWWVTTEQAAGINVRNRIDVSLSNWKRWTAGAERIDICSECGKNPADLPSRLCAGCDAYQEHTAHA